MNNLLKLLIVISLISIAGCSSNTPFKSQKNKEAKKSLIVDKRIIAADSIWIVKQDGLQGDAGLIADGAWQAVDSLSVQIDITEFLASVDVSIKYLELEQGNKLTFKYPGFKGMLVRDFLLSIGQRKFRAIVSDKESAEMLFDLAKKRGHNAFLVSQKAFSEMLVDIALKQKESITVDFNYSQLTAVSDGKRVLTLPKFKGLDHAETELELKGEFSSDLTSFSGLKKEISGRRIYESITDKKLLQEGLEIYFSLKSMKPLSSNGRQAVIWDSKKQNFLAVDLGEKAEWQKVSANILDPVFSFLELQEMISKGKPFKEVQNFAIKSKMLTPFTKLLLVDSQK